MKVLQLGPEDWTQSYTIPDNIDWDVNTFPPKKKKKKLHYDVVIITGAVNMSDLQWEVLRMASVTYSVLYLPGVPEQLGAQGKLFLKEQAAIEITHEPQEVIDNLDKYFYFGQTGIRLSPTNLVINRLGFPVYAFTDGYHLQVDVDADNWQTLGTYKMTPYYDAGKQLSLWLECTQSPNLDVRLLVYNLQGNADQSFTMPIKGQNELIVPMGVTDYARFIGVSIQVKGQGLMQVGTFHYRWTRHGYGNYIAGGRKLVNPANNEEIAYYLNPGNLKPPLFVYFSGARGLEGFEAYPLFRSTGKPALLFTDPRLQMGQFYTGDYFQREIKKVIRQTVERFGFTMQDVVTSGLSMGSYPALKLGAELGVHAIICGKQLTNLGYLAERAPRERPYGFDTGLDITARNAKNMSSEALKDLDRRFWEKFNETNLSQTKLFIIYMLDDDYDNRTIDYLKKSPAVVNGKQFIHRGIAGRHNDNTADVSGMFVDRIYDMINTDFKGNE